MCLQYPSTLCVVFLSTLKVAGKYILDIILLETTDYFLQSLGVMHIYALKWETFHIITTTAHQAVSIFSMVVVVIL